MNRSAPRAAGAAPAVAVLTVLAVLAVLAVLTLAGCAGPTGPGPAGGPGSPPAGGPAAPSTEIARGVDIGGRQVYLECHGSSAPGGPTVVLISGYHDAGDAWDVDELTAPPAVGPPVPKALATRNRVCTYDRPGTLRYGVDGNPLTDRSTPVPQPRTAADVVAELHAVLRSGAVPGPYVLTAHSMGGLFALLYARTYPDEVRGIVFDDAFSPTVPAVFGAKWPLYRDYLNAAPAGTQLATPSAEQVDEDASVAQVTAAPPLRPMPMVVLTKTEPFRTTLVPPAGLTSEELNRLYESAETALVRAQPGIPQVFATGSDHYIQWHEPDLVVAATELVLGRVRR
jgi:pimeloyl-ACP methyl ester carboxylesterase